MAVWYQSYSGGPRWARLTIKNVRGRTVFHRRVRATTVWTPYYYTPRCGRRYRVTYVVAGGTVTYRVRVRR